MWKFRDLNSFETFSMLFVVVHHVVFYLRHVVETKFAVRALVDDFVEWHYHTVAPIAAPCQRPSSFQ